MSLQTEFPFTLPRGYVDGEGTLHRDGVMRLATAYEEIAPLRDPRVRANEAYLVIILISRVITKLGSLEHICLREVIFDKDIDPDALTDNLCKLLFEGIANPRAAV